MLTPTLFNIFQNQPVLHANSTRIGGLSNGAFYSLNLGLNTNDKKETVNKNRALFFDYFAINLNRLVFPQQVHSDHIEIVDQPGRVEKCDALITNSVNLILTIQTADCFPLFLYDPMEHVCAVVHSGWRGTANNIATKTISKMQKYFGSKSSNLLISIGAGIQQKNYQVDSITAGNFSSQFLVADGQNHFKLSVQDAIISQLLEKGVRKKNIEIDRTGTFEAKNKYFSYRRDGANSGRMMGFIGLSNTIPK